MSVRHGLLHLTLVSGLATALLLARVVRTGEPLFLFLLWNLALAWLPYLWSLLATGAHRRGWGLALLPPLGALWLLFLPNAPYLVTDLIHLPAGSLAPRWFDAGLLGLFAWCGVSLGAYSLAHMSELVSELAGEWAGRLFVPLVCGLSGYGIYLGRVERWNSWDLLFSTRDLLAAMLGHLRHPLADPALLGLSAFYALLFLGAYYSLVIRPVAPDSKRAVGPRPARTGRHAGGA